MKITPRTAEAAAPTGSGTASTLSGSTCVMAFNSGTADRLITIQTGKFAVASLAITAAGASYTAGTLSATGGGGSGFAGSFGVSGTGAINAVTVISPGDGYTSAPTIVPSSSGDGNAVIAATLVSTATIGSFIIDGGERLFIEKDQTDGVFAANAEVKLTGVVNR